MGKLKLMTIIGTRPEIIRLSATIKCCDRYFEQILIHTGQNYDYTLNQVFFDDLGLRVPDYYLDAVGDDLGATIGNIIEKSYKLMVQVRPDAVLVLGDTNSCLSVIGAKRLHIPIFHMEAGNRCKDECLPEETNRRIVDTDILVAAGSPTIEPSAVDESVTEDVPVPPDSPTVLPEGSSIAEAEMARDAIRQTARTREMIFLVFFMVCTPFS